MGSYKQMEGKSWDERNFKFKDCKMSWVKCKNGWTRAKTRRHETKREKISEERREPKKLNERERAKEVPNADL